jgi:hypothetical protein
MKPFRLLLIATGLTLALSSCSRLFQPKYGCPSNGKNVGAERLLSDPSAARKAKKFRD